MEFGPPHLHARDGMPSSFTSPSPFLRLPEEIHTHIMSFLPVPCMLAHGRTCKLLYLHLSSSLLLQSLIALHTHSLLPLPTLLTPAQVLGLLQSHTSSWTARPVKPSKVSRLRLPEGLGLGWKTDMRGGWWGECDERRVVVLPLPGRRDLVPSTPPSQTAAAPPESSEASASEDRDVRVYHLPGAGREEAIEDLRLDPAQDLVLLVTRPPDRSTLTLHPLTLHFLPHPAAPPSPLHYSQPWRGDFPGVKLLALTLSPHPSRPLIALIVLSFLGRKRVNELVVFDWHTGGVWKQDTGGRGYDSLSFLGDGGTLVAGCLTGDPGPTLDVYSLSGCSGPVRGDIKPGGVGGGGESSPESGKNTERPIRLVRSFALPPLRQDIRLSLSLSSNLSSPFPSLANPSPSLCSSRRVESPSVNGAEPYYPWHCPPSHQLLALTLRPVRVTSRVAESAGYVLFFLARTLLQADPPSSPTQEGTTLLPLDSAGGEAEEVHPIPWSEWGPEHTRLFPLPSASRSGWVQRTHGTRAVLPFAAPARGAVGGVGVPMDRAGQMRSGEGEAHAERFQVLDFSPHALAFHASRRPSSPEREADDADEFVTHPSELPPNPFFDGPIITSLPYQTSHAQVGAPPSWEELADALQQQPAAQEAARDRRLAVLGVWADDERLILQRREDLGVGEGGGRRGGSVLDVGVI